MAVPRKKHTKSHRNNRRMNIFITPPSFSKCPKCGKIVLPHAICWNCGYYKGREVINVLAKLEKKERKQREKEIKSQEGQKQEEKPLTMEGLSKK
jgi:large subunit ribosomal protein L32